MKPLLFIALLIALCSGCSSGNEETKDTGGTGNQNPTPKNEVDFYLTKGDQSQKLHRQTDILTFDSSFNDHATIEVDDSQTYQSVSGFGFTLTGGSAELINSLNSSDKETLLQELFGKTENSISLSYLRISIGASDLNPVTFSYDDMPEGQTDEDLSEFSLEPDMADLIPLLQEILEINPDLKIMGSPWSPPVWMKDNKNTVGGSLKPEFYDVYAQYFVKYIQKMKELGISIDAITPQNEPLHPGNNPSMLMLSEDQIKFIAYHLGPAFEQSEIDTKIIIYDHNADNPEYPLTVLRNDVARPYIDGTAFHLYAGDISALSKVHNAFPQKDLYFTEQYTSSDGDFGEDLQWHLKNVIIGSMRNWSKTALEWNLANDSSYKPHTEGGCTTCKGGITISGSSTFFRNVGYYIIGHASKFVPPASVRIASNIAGNLYNVAFHTPDGKKVLIVVNTGNTFELFNVKYNGKWFESSLEAGSVGTYVW